MSDAMGDVKVEKMDSFQSTDSFDEPKGVPISMEPVFSTAAGVRIDVKQESIDKSRKLLNNEKSLKSCAESSASTSRKQFSSPLIKSQINSEFPYISPFRKENTPMRPLVAPAKRAAVKNHEKSPENGAPPAKKSAIENSTNLEKKPTSRKERRELHLNVLRISKVHEKERYRIIAQESKTSPLILATISARRGADIKFGDKLHVEAEILKKNNQDDPIEIYLEKVIKNRKNGAESGIRRHSIAKFPYCLEPKFIHELAEPVKKAVLQVNILDLKLEIYQGCSKCNYLWLKDSGRRTCAKCKSSRSEIRNMVFSRMRVADFSGQIFINVNTKTMEKFLELLGFKGIEQWFQFTDPNERHNYVFRPIMIEVEKVKNEWECTDVADVDWNVFSTYLNEKKAKSKSKSP